MSTFYNETITRITLHTDDRNSCTVHVHAKQHDHNTRYIQAVVLSKAGTVNMHGSFAQMNATMPDGKKIYIIGTVDEDGVVTIGVSGEILSTPGRITCDLSFFDSQETMNTLLTTMTFYIMVEASNYDPDASENDAAIDGDPSIVEQMVQQTVDASVAKHETNTESHADIRQEIINLKGEFEEQIGDVGAALDTIIAKQNTVLGGDSV